jgi:hypothetical protein
LIDAVAGMVHVIDAAQQRGAARKDLVGAKKKRPDREGPGEVIGSR